MRTGRANSGLHDHQLSSLVEDVVDALIVTDPSGNVIFMNSAASNLYGFESLARREVATVNLLEFQRQTFDFKALNGEAVPEEQQPVTRALSGLHFRDVELAVWQKGSSEERIFAFSSTGLDGDPPLRVLTIRDVTDARKADRRFRISFETNPAPTVVARLDDGTILDVNEGFSELTGFLERQVEGRTLASMGILPLQDDLDEVIERLTEGEVVRQQPTMIKRKGADVLDVLLPPGR